MPDSRFPIRFRRELAPVVLGLLLTAGSLAHGQAPRAGLPRDRVYQGPIRLPDFAGRDRKFADCRTRIREGMNSGPDFAGHCAVIQIGCGTGCNFAYLGDVATGQVYDFPHGGEAQAEMQIFHSAKSSMMTVLWKAEERCHRAWLAWDGATFQPKERTELGPAERCDGF